MTYQRTCPVCGKAFETWNPSQTMCGRACREIRERERTRERNRQVSEKRALAAWKAERKCRICGAPFVPSLPQQTICRNPECRREDNRRRMRKRTEEKREMEIKIEVPERAEGEPMQRTNWRNGMNCRVCGTFFYPKQSSNTICPNPECKREASRANTRAANHARGEMRRDLMEKGLGKKPFAALDKLGENVRADPKPKRRKKGPQPGSIEWCVAEADRLGLTYGQFVSRLNAESLSLE